MLATYNDSDYALVSAPPVDIFGGFSIDGFSIDIHNGLRDPKYVRHINVEVKASIVPDETLQSNLTYKRPVSNAVVRGSWKPSGIAFREDANETLLSDSRSVHGVDQVSAKVTGIRVAVLDTGLPPPIRPTIRCTRIASWP